MLTKALLTGRYDVREKDMSITTASIHLGKCIRDAYYKKEGGSENI